MVGGNLFLKIKMTKKAQIPIIFIFIFAIVVAGLLLVWGVSAIFKITDISEKAEYKITINDLKQEVQKMYSYEPGSTKILQLKTPERIKQLCFANKELITTTTNEELIFLIQNSNFNTFILPLDAFEQTGFNIPNLRSRKNPDCITTNNQLKAKLTTMNEYVQIESA